MIFGKISSLNRRVTGAQRGVWLLVPSGRVHPLLLARTGLDLKSRDFHLSWYTLFV
jgi:hypothetical protein